MNPDALRLFFRLGVWITGLSLCLVFAVPRERAEWTVSVCSLLIGAALLGGVTVISYATRR